MEYMLFIATDTEPGTSTGEPDIDEWVAEGERRGIRIRGDALQPREDATSDAFATALVRWEADGPPPNPAAWLALTARNRAIDLLRRAATERSKLVVSAVADESTVAGDERLRLIFTCCHPALALDAQVALTLRTVAGLEVADIARAFLVTEPTMAQRLVRARRKIAHAGIPYQVPSPEQLEPRLAGVLAVIYLAFNQGYSSAADTALASTAVDLARQLVELMPGESEARGLLALLMLQHSRRDARVGPDGELRSIEEQDRRLWKRSEIARAGRELRAARAPGPYVLQASIAEVHATAHSAAATRWDRIVALYDELVVTAPSPVVELNRAIAVVRGVEAPHDAWCRGNLTCRRPRRAARTRRRRWPARPRRVRSDRRPGWPSCPRRRLPRPG
jgi:RNA polymerase sigma-70 factor (ECF subfamily)